MGQVVLLLGSNLGDREQSLEHARNLIANKIGPIVRKSAVYQSEAWGMDENTPPFLNQVLCVQTDLSPEEVLVKIDRMEDKPPSGNTDTYQSRYLDIDILFYDRKIIHEKQLRIPHPLIQKRNFALVPLREIMPNFVHPELDETIETLYEQSEDDCKVVPTT